MPLRLKTTGPLAIFEMFKDEWLTCRQAGVLFFISAVLVAAFQPLLHVAAAPSSSAVQRVAHSGLGVVLAISTLFLWVGMWRYWVRIDASSKPSKTFWFIVLLFGFWYGSALYFLFVYLPQFMQRKAAGNL
jgi:hypothetical protein